MAESGGDSPPSQDTPGLRTNRACQNCVRIKAKCVPLPDLRICQRCHRLGKSCSSAPPPARKKREETSHRVAQLEKRLDGFNQILNALLKDSKTDDSIGSLPTPATTSTSSDAPASHNEPNLFCGNPSAFISKANSHHAALFPRIDPVLEAEVLAEFSQTLNDFFPFVVVPRYDSPFAFWKERPNLYRSCLFAGCRWYPDRQRKMAEAILRHVGVATFSFGERSLDLLQGLLVFTCWYHVHGNTNPQLMNLLHLSMSLVIDLGLDCSSVRSNIPTANTISTHAEGIIHGRTAARGVKNNEERRAVLGCYYFTSTYSFCLHRLDYLKFTPHLEQCRNDLAAAAEHPSDMCLVAVITLHQIVEKYLTHADAKPCPNLPLSLYIESFNQDFQSLLATTTPGVLDSAYFSLHLVSSQLNLYESIMTIPCTNTLPKVEALHTCLLKTHEFFTTFLSQYNATTPNASYFSWIRLIHCLSVLTKLSFLHLEGWNLEYVRSTVKFCELIDMLNERLLAVHEAGSRSSGMDFSKRTQVFKYRLDKCKAWFGDMLEKEAKAMQEESQGGKIHVGPEADGPVLGFGENMFEGMLGNLDEYLNLDFVGPGVGWFEGVEQV